MSNTEVTNMYREIVASAKPFAASRLMDKMYITIPPDNVFVNEHEGKDVVIFHAYDDKGKKRASSVYTLRSDQTVENIWHSSDAKGLIYRLTLMSAVKSVTDIIAPSPWEALIACTNSTARRFAYRSIGEMLTDNSWTPPQDSRMVYVIGRRSKNYLAELAISKLAYRLYPAMDGSIAVMMPPNRAWTDNRPQPYDDIINDAAAGRS